MIHWLAVSCIYNPHSAEMGIKVSLPVIVNYLRIDVWPAPAAVNSTVEQHGEIIIYNIPRDIVTLLPLSPRASSGGGMQIMCAAECVGSSERAEVVVFSRMEHFLGIIIKPSHPSF